MRMWKHGKRPLLLKQCQEQYVDHATSRQKHAGDSPCNFPPKNACSSSATFRAYMKSMHGRSYDDVITKTKISRIDGLP